MKYGLSRKQRAAAASMSMIVVSVFSLIFLHFGHVLIALGFELMSILFYSVWVYRGKPEESDDL